MEVNLNKTREKCTKYNISIYTVLKELKYRIMNEIIKLHKSKIINCFANKEFSRSKIEYIKLSTRNKYTRCRVLKWSKNMSTVILMDVNRTVAMLINKSVECIQNRDNTINLEIETEWRTL